MATTKKRLNVTLSPELERAVIELAKRDNVPQSAKAAELLRTALEIEEDEVWDALAQERDQPKAKWVSHDSTWA